MPKWVTKKGRTEEKKLVFGINEKVRLQCPKTKLWNICEKVHGIRFNEAGTIVSYEIMLENGNVTTRHCRFMTKDLPEVEGSEPVIHEVEPVIHGESNITESGHSEHGVITRSKRRMHANTACGKFHGKSRRSSQVILHSHLGNTEEMAVPCHCCSWESMQF